MSIKKRISYFSIREHWTVVRVELRVFLEKANSEVDETKEIGAILKRHVAGEEITHEEKEKVRKQLIDILKGLGLAVPFVLLPGASLVLPFLVKFAQKNGVKILPSSFEELKKP